MGRSFSIDLLNMADFAIMHILKAAKNIMNECIGF